MTTLSMVEVEQFESIKNERPAEWVSNRYRLENTTKILDRLNSLGWVLNSVKGNKRNPYAPHTLTFSKSTKTLNNGMVVTPVIYVQNGHDGRTTLKLRIGFLNQNLSFMADEEIFGYSVKHYQKGLDYAEEFLKAASVEGKLDEMFRIVEQMLTRTVTPEERIRYVRGSLIIRWTDPDKSRRIHNIEPESVSKATNLFQLYADVSQCLVGGGEYKMNDKGRVTRFKVRGLRSSVAEAKYKERLWTWTMKVMEKI